MPRFYFRQLLAAALALVIGVTAASASDTRRIISIGGAVTEILYALGVDKDIVGIDTTSLYPQRAVREKASVGYMRQLSAEGVLGLRPTLILAIEGAGPKETIAVLKAAQVPMVIVPDTFSGDGILEKIKVVSKAVNADARGECIAADVRADLSTLKKLRSAVRASKRVMFVLSLVGGRTMVSGRNTAADGIIHMAGATNAITEYEGYKPISDEAVIAAKPDIILAMDRGGPNPVNAEQLFALPAFSGTPAAAGKHFIAMDGLYLLGFGPRSARAARDLAMAIYPGLAEGTPSPGQAPHSSCQE